MKICFIIDDNDIKRKCIEDNITQVFPEADTMNFSVVSDFVRYMERYGIKAVSESPNDYIILTDMIMPLDHYKPVNENAGYVLLTQMDALGVKCPVIVVSSDSINADRAKECYSYYAGFVLYYRNEIKSYKYTDVINKYLFESNGGN